jgi:hypothetical protein
VKDPPVMRRWGKTADLCQYGYHVVPLSFLEEVKENERK